MKPFIPTVLRMKMDDKEGYLISYDELHKTFNIPDEYIITEIEDAGNNLLVTLHNKKHIKINRQHIIEKELKQFSVKIVNKHFLQERLGMNIELLETNIYCRQTDNTFKQMYSLGVSAILKRKQLWVWFTNRKTEDLCDEGIFIPENTLIKNRY